MNRTLLRNICFTIALLSLVTLLAVFIVNAVIYLTVHNVAYIETPGSLIVSPAPPIDWGRVTRGQTHQRSLTLTNIGTLPCSNLRMTVQDISPYGLTLSWDGGGYTLDGGESLLVNFTLTVLAGPYLNGTCTFNFSIAGD